MLTDEELEKAIGLHPDHGERGRSRLQAAAFDLVRGFKLLKEHRGASFDFTPPEKDAQGEVHITLMFNNVSSGVSSKIEVKVASNNSVVVDDRQISREGIYSDNGRKFRHLTQDQAVAEALGDIAERVGECMQEAQAPSKASGIKNRAGACSKEAMIRPAASAP